MISFLTVNIASQNLRNYPQSNQTDKMRKILKLQWHKSLPSTQDYLIENQTDEIIITKEQTKGRGRTGNGWTGMTGSLYFSFESVADNHNDSNDSCMTDFGVKGYLRVLGALKLTFLEYGIESIIKWPNDILIRSECTSEYFKVTGVLIDHLIDQQFTSRNRCIVGVGVNLGFLCCEADDHCEECQCVMIDVSRNDIIRNIDRNDPIQPSSFKTIRELTCKNIKPMIFLTKFFSRYSNAISEEFQYDLPDRVTFGNEDVKVVDKKDFVIEMESGSVIRVDECFFGYDWEKKVIEKKK